MESFGDFARREVTGARIRAAEPVGFDEALWRATAAIGGLGIGIPVERGGGGAGLVEAALVVEQFGARLAPIPLVEALVSGRLLSRIDLLEATDLLSRLVDGSTLVTIALRPVDNGRARLVPAGAVAGALLAIVDEELVIFEGAAGEYATWFPNLGATPLADWDLRGTRARCGTRGGDVAAMAHAVDEWRVLTAASLVGLGAAALDLGVKYVKERSQFGRLIASFQSVAHGLADVATMIDGARLIAYEAAWALDEHTADAAALASMALNAAAEAAARSTYASLHYHGGYGFMEEYDIQLYYRRARGWPMIIGPADGELLTLADRLWPNEPTS